MKHSFLLLILALPCGAAQLQAPNTNPAPCTITLAWDASPDPTVTGYFIYTGTNSGQYTAKSNLNAKVSYTLTLGYGPTYYFAATAYNAGGLESQFSSEVIYRPIQSATNTPPTGPPNLKAPIVLTVQYKNALQDYQWADLFNFSPSNGQWFRLQAQAAPPAPTATLNRNLLKRALAPAAPH